MAEVRESEVPLPEQGGKAKPGARCIVCNEPVVPGYHPLPHRFADGWAHHKCAKKAAEGARWITGLE